MGVFFVEVHISCILIRGTFVASIEGGGEGVGGDYRCTHCTPYAYGPVMIKVKSVYEPRGPSGLSLSRFL